MKPTKLLIIGGVAGGASAATRARRLCEEAEIVVVERGPFVSFANCGLPYYLGGEIASEDALRIHTPESLRASFNLDVRVRTEATAINRKARTVTLRDLARGREGEESYDALILAPGAAPLRPPIPGIEREGHFVVRDIPDVQQIDAWIRTHDARRAVIVGGGYIGLEMAEQFARRGLEIAIGEMLPQVMAPLDPEMAAWLHQELRANGVDLHLGDGVAGFEPAGPGEGAAASVVVLQSGARLPADVVILGLGVRPEVALARDAGLEIGERRGIRVDTGMRTSDAAIWAVGDAVEIRHAVTGEWTLMALAGPANHQGRIAADNIFGRESRYRGAVGTAVLRLFSLTAACTGANEATLQRAGIEYHTLHVHPQDHAGYYPGAERLDLKLLYAPDEGRLLGAQAVGKSGVDKRIDVLATAIRAGMSVRDLVDLELAYSPPYGAAKDPVNLAGMAASNQLDGLVEKTRWSDVTRLQEQGALLLDVRTAEEWEAGRLPGAVHIPLAELRSRLAELPAEQEIVAYCGSGHRSYNACRLLEQRGHRCRNLSGGYRTWRTATAGNSEG